MAWCRRIIAEEVPPRTPGEPVSDQALRVHVAGQTLAEWEDVLKGRQDYVHINDSYLGDYAAAAAAWLAGGAEVSPGNP
jgi:hypothetical protein